MHVAASLLFYNDIERWIDYLLFGFALVIEIVALGHCLVQRPDAFPAINTLSKGAWLALTGGSVLVTLLAFRGMLFGLVAIAIAAVYLLDVRPALRDGVDGHGSW